MSQILTRRGLVAVAPAAVVAAVMPARAGAHPDAALLALRVPYERTLAVMTEVSPAHSRAEDAYFALKSAQPDLDERALRKASGLIPAERAWQARHQRQPCRHSPDNRAARSHDRRRCLQGGDLGPGGQRRAGPHGVDRRRPRCDGRRTCVSKRLSRAGASPRPSRSRRSSARLPSPWLRMPRPARMRSCSTSGGSGSLRTSSTSPTGTPGRRFRKPRQPGGTLS